MARHTATTTSGTDVWIRERLHLGLRTLLAASRYAELDQTAHNAFAVEITTLRRQGVDECDLRWLLSQSLVTHLVEITLPGDIERTFRQGGISLADNSCFLLTAEGYSFARELVHTNAAETQRDVPGAQEEHEEGRLNIRPIWDDDRRELYFHGTLVKRFRLPSPNQTAILSVFEEEDWPARIDDPLPPMPDIDPKRRLHDTIRNLNRAHHQPLLRFVGDGSGQGVLWELVTVTRTL